ncbi:c-type cytochrome biogenesis protein CcmI [Hyphococcus sp.]|jgi:cytochrome c-type biogenesis protein CcmH|uniref:c-type cytochrome biogenesis protein CcmI n=1 Tax=Hyphococcus sp. TaxID=2038636 RepID=UPI003D101960
MIWIAILVIALAALVLLIEPFLRARNVAAPLDEEDYLAAQIADIARDREAGLISAEEAESADKEARRRLLAAHRAAEKKMEPPSRTALRPVVVALAALAPLAAFFVYGLLGNPSGETTRAGEELAARARVQMAADMSPEDRAQMISGMVEGLAARLEDNPDDLEGWTMLGRSYAVMGDYEKSAAAYDRAIALSPEDPNLHVNRIQALMSALDAKGEPMNEEAEAAVEALASLNRDHPFALYFQGLAASQKGDAEAAREYWSRLVAMMPEEAPERARLVEMINAL